MNVLIIEDEYHAVRRLQSLLEKVMVELEILAVIDNVEESVEWFQNHVHPDLVFMDIQLADGISFSIFKEVEIESPIIFTTAYDQYSLKAFKVNSIDYLLKPIDEEELQKAILKYEKMNKASIQPDLSSLTTLLKGVQFNKKYKERFLLKNRDKYTFLLSDEIAYFYSEDSVTFVVTVGGKSYVYDDTLNQLSEQLNPEHFFRINRKQILHIQSILKIHNYFNNRMKLELKPKLEQETIVARDKVKAFKHWLGA